MATASDIMDRHFLDASQADSILELLHEMDDRGIESAPLLDPAGKPIGVVTVRDVESCHSLEELADHLTHSAVCVDEDTPIELAAWTAAVHESAAVVLVDKRGVAVGALSALDLLRAMVGLDARDSQRRAPRPSTSWSAPVVLEIGEAHRAPAAPGIILLMPGADGGNRRQVWAESTPDIQERLDQMLRSPQDDAALESMLEAYPRTVRFRYLVVPDAEQRERLARAIQSMAKAGAREEDGSDPAALPDRARKTPPMRDAAH